MKQIRNTVQKKTILEVVGNMKNHPSAAMVYEEVQKVLPKVSRATVYRVLQDAAENGDILKVQVSNSGDRFDFNTKKHYHVRCTKCNEVSDVCIEYLSGLENRADANSDYQISEHNIEFYGICPKCQVINEE